MLAHSIALCQSPLSTHCGHCAVGYTGHVTWKQAAHAFVDLEGFNQSVDPFYVPDRASETISFFAAAIFAALVISAPFFVPLTTRNLGVLLGAAMLVALAVFRGLRSRERRLLRARAVAELRARLEREANTRS